MSIIRNAAGDPLYPCSNNFVAEDTSFVAGDSPATLDVNGTLSRNGQRGYVANDGSGDIAVEISHNGSAYQTSFTLKNGEFFDLTGWDVDSLRLTHSGTDSSYRVQCW